MPERAEPERPLGDVRFGLGGQSCICELKGGDVGSSSDFMSVFLGDICWLPMALRWCVQVQPPLSSWLGEKKGRRAEWPLLLIGFIGSRPPSAGPVFPCPSVLQVLARIAAKHAGLFGAKQCTITAAQEEPWVGVMSTEEAIDYEKLGEKKNRKGDMPEPWALALRPGWSKQEGCHGCLIVDTRSRVQCSCMLSLP